MYVYTCVDRGAETTYFDMQCSGHYFTAWPRHMTWIDDNSQEKRDLIRDGCREECSDCVSINCHNIESVRQVCYAYMI